jgi:hypothetical protein
MVYEQFFGDQERFWGTILDFYQMSTFVFYGTWA